MPQENLADIRIHYIYTRGLQYQSDDKALDDRLRHNQPSLSLFRDPTGDISVGYLR